MLQRITWKVLYTLSCPEDDQVLANPSLHVPYDLFPATTHHTYRQTLPGLSSQPALTSTCNCVPSACLCVSVCHLLHAYMYGIHRRCLNALREVRGSTSQRLYTVHTCVAY